MYLLGVADRLNGRGIENQQRRLVPGCYAPVSIQEAGGVGRCAPKRRPFRQPGPDQKLEFPVYRVTVESANVARVGPGEHGNAGMGQRANRFAIRPQECTLPCHQF